MFIHLKDLSLGFVRPIYIVHRCQRILWVSIGIRCNSIFPPSVLSYQRKRFICLYPHWMYYVQCKPEGCHQCDTKCYCTPDGGTLRVSYCSDFAYPSIICLSYFCLSWGIVLAIDPFELQYLFLFPLVIFLVFMF